MCVLSVSLQTLVPAVDWMPYLTEVFAPVPLNESEPVVVYAKEYLQQVSELILKTNKRSASIVFPFMRQMQVVCYTVCVSMYLRCMCVNVFTLFTCINPPTERHNGEHSGRQWATKQ